MVGRSFGFAISIRVYLRSSVVKPDRSFRVVRGQIGFGKVCNAGKPKYHRFLRHRCLIAMQSVGYT
jgi:hypothetical protein